MKQTNLFLVCAAIILPFFSCADDDANWHLANTEVSNTFHKMYPSAKNVEWETKGTYTVADFRNDNMDTEAWFDAQGVWYMTETDLPYSSLPEAIVTAFKASEYGSWRVDDVDMLERKDMETVYIIEVESGKQEMDLYYTADGTLVKTVADNDNTDYSQHITPVAGTIEAYINENYPSSRIVEIETERNGNIEVDIIHDGKSKEVVFNSANQWLYTSWDVRISTLPQAVAAIVNTTQYTGYHIDDAEYVETSTGNYYLLELEKGNSEIYVKVDAGGAVVS